MTEDPPEGGDPIAFESILSVQDAIDDNVFFEITQIDDFPAGSATYEGVATVQTVIDRSSGEVSFVAIGSLDAEVDFVGNSLTATADNFFEVDPVLFNNTLQTQTEALGEIDGELSVVSGVGSEQELSDLLGETQEVALGLGALTGSITQIDGTVLEFNDVAGVTFLNSQDEDAALLVIGGPTEFGSTPTDEPVNTFSLIGLQQ